MIEKLIQTTKSLNELDKIVRENIEIIIDNKELEKLIKLKRYEIIEQKLDPKI